MREVPVAARLLGLAGLIPFAALALLCLAGPEPWRAPAREGLALYGAAILAFMGGCRWGFAAAGLGSGPGWGPLLAAVLPPLWAWAAIWAAPAPFDMLLLALGLALLLAADLTLARRGGAPEWWPALRWPLSVLSVTALLAGAAA